MKKILKFEVQETGKWRKKRKNQVKRDTQFKTIIREHKNGRVSDDEYTRKILKTVKMHDLPKTRRALLKALESDSDSD